MRCTVCRQYKGIENFPWVTARAPGWRRNVCQKCTVRLHTKQDTGPTGPFKTFGLADFFRPKPPKA